jgi:hypothetical protein
MFDEQVLHHAVVRQADLDRRLGPPSAAYPADDFEEGDVAAEPGPLQPAFAPPEASPPEPQAPEQTDEREESDAAFSARATALFNATLSQAPPEIRELLATFSQEELSALIGSVWPEPEGDAQPQAP